MINDKYYILDGHELVTVDLMTWAEWFGRNDRHVAQTTLGNHLVSTVFLGLDHQFGEGPPLLFETMVFTVKPDGKIDYTELAIDRYSTWEEAEAGHQAMVKKWATEDQPAISEGEE